MKKTDAIREVAKDRLHLTNRQIKEEVRLRHEFIVSSSSIINVLGSHQKRLRLARGLRNIKNKAKDFLRLVGDYDQARKLLALANEDFQLQ